MKFKNVNDIFRDNDDLKELNPVSQLIDYCKELEDELITLQNESSDVKLNELSELVRDIYNSIADLEKQKEEEERFKESNTIDYKDAFKNLKTYLENFARDTKFNLYV